MPEYQLPFPHSVSFLPLVIVWYLLAEFGSIIENAAKMGAPVPNFLRHRIKSLNEAISSGENQSKNTSTK
ncbi:phage holin family protein [Ruthenibacterium lactatiformans]